jgi:hypothetical protein
MFSKHFFAIYAKKNAKIGLNFVSPQYVHDFYRNKSLKMTLNYTGLTLI